MFLVEMASIDVSQVKAFSCLQMVHCMSFTSFGYSQFVGSKSRLSALSCVKYCPGMKSGGCEGKGFNMVSGSSGKVLRT